MRLPSRATLHHQVESSRATLHHQVESPPTFARDPLLELLDLKVII